MASDVWRGTQPSLCCASQDYIGPITRWVNSMSAYAKAHNKQQLITMGQEGFFSNNISPYAVQLLICHAACLFTKSTGLIDLRRGAAGLRPTTLRGCPATCRRAGRALWGRTSRHSISAATSTSRSSISVSSIGPVAGLDPESCSHCPRSDSAASRIQTLALSLALTLCSAPASMARSGSE